MSRLHYPTIKYVYLPDKRLGMMYYSLLLLVLVYAIITIILNKGYLTFDNQPLTAVSPRVAKALEKTSDSANVPPYCTDVLRTSDSPNPAQSASCKSKCVCREWSPTKLAYPPPTHEISITTYVEENENEENETRFFTLEPEHLIIKLDHAIASTMVMENHSGNHDDPDHVQQQLEEENLGASSRQMYGRLLGHDGKVVQEFPPNAGRLERISIEDLLHAAGLPDGLETPSFRRATHSLRRVGAVLHVTITYRNSHLTFFGTHHIEYEIKAAMQPFMENMMLELVSGKDHESLRKRAGLRIEIHQEGKLGKMSFLALLQALGSTAGLFTLVALLTDYAALYLFPEKSKRKHELVMYERYSEETYDPVTPHGTVVAGDGQVSHCLPQQSPVAAANESEGLRKRK